MSSTFKELPSAIRKGTAAWQLLFDATEPQNVELPGEFAEISAFEKLLIIRMIRPDKLVPAVRISHPASTPRGLQSDGSFVSSTAIHYICPYLCMSLFCRVHFLTTKWQVMYKLGEGVLQLHLS